MNMILALLILFECFVSSRLDIGVNSLHVRGMALLYVFKHVFTMEIGQY